MLTAGQELTFEYQGTNYLLRASTLTVIDPSAEQQSVQQGMLIPETAFVFEVKHGSGIKISGQRRCSPLGAPAPSAASHRQRLGPALRLPQL